MLLIDATAFDALRRAQIARLVRRIDDWLMTASQGWIDRDGDERRAELADTLARGSNAGLRTENDLALFAKLLADLASQRGPFLEHPAVKDVLAWELRNQGAKLHELYRIAEPTVRLLHSKPQGGIRQ